MRGIREPQWSQKSILPIATILTAVRGVFCDVVWDRQTVEYWGILQDLKSEIFSPDLNRWRPRKVLPTRRVEKGPTLDFNCPHWCRCACYNSATAMIPLFAGARFTEDATNMICCPFSVCSQHLTSLRNSKSPDEASIENTGILAAVRASSPTAA